MKINRIVVYLISFLIICYLVIDVSHFFIFRISPSYSSSTEAFFESGIISYIKWSLCLLILAGVTLDIKNKRLSFYLMFIPSIAVFLLFFLKGQIVHLFIGSIVFELGVLEIMAFITLIYVSFYLIRKYKISLLGIILSLFLTIVFLWFLINQLPVYRFSTKI
jgi:hypothetical protein